MSPPRTVPWFEKAPALLSVSPDRVGRWGGWAGILAFLALISSGDQVVDLDVFHEMALAREAIAAGSFPRDDVFAYTSTVSPTVHHEWGHGFVLYAIAVATGWGAAGLLLLWYLLLGGTAAFSYAAARARGGSIRLLALLAPLTFILLRPWLGVVRAQMFTFLGLAALLYLLELDRRGRRWWIPVWLAIYVLWVNLHAGFVVGAGVLAVHTTERFLRVARAAGVREAWSETRHLAAVGTAMAPLTLINPYGWSYLSYLVHGIGLERPLIAEWGPLWSAPLPIIVVTVFAFSLLLICYAVARLGLRGTPGLLLLSVTAVLAVQHARHGALYAVVWFAYTPAYLSDTSLGTLVERLWRRYARAISVSLVVLALGAGGYRLRSGLALPVVSNGPGTRALSYPVGAVDYLEEIGFRGNLMTDFNSGSFVSWKLHPAVKVSLDSRYEVAYPPVSVQEHVSFFAGEPGWESLLDRYPTHAVLVRRTSALNSLLDRPGETQHAWERVYRDDSFSVFVRADLARGLPDRDRTGEIIKGAFP